MTLTVHHLQRSQSERIVWLCEELGIPYDLKIHQREAVGLGAPPALKAIHPSGTAPVIEDDDEDGRVVMSESGAIMDYILHKHGNGRHLAVPPASPDHHHAELAFWYHWAIGTLQSTQMTLLALAKAGVPHDNAVRRDVEARLHRALALMDERLRRSAWLAGDEATKADVYAVFCVSTMRLFTPFALTPYEGIRRWLGEVARRPAYRSAMEKAEPGEVPVLGAEAPPGPGPGPV